MRINHDEWRDIGQAVYVKCTHFGLSICVGVNYRISVKKNAKDLPLVQCYVAPLGWNRTFHNNLEDFLQTSNR
jgi:hypothetical protein